MNISGIDLNLIIVFDAVYRTCNVSLAAKEIGLTQPSVSAALKRLREITGDELFTRLSKGVQPTTKAHEISKNLASAIELIKAGLLEKNEFDIKAYKRTFRLGIVDVFIYSIFPEILKIIEKEAPHIKIIPVHYSQSEFSKQLRSGHFDIVLATSGYTDDTLGLFSEHLFDDSYCVISRRNHPAIKKNLTLQNYLKEDHIITSFEGNLMGEFDKILSTHKLKRSVKMSVPNFMTVPFLVESTHLLAGISLKTALKFKNHAKIDIHKIPFKTPALKNRLYWYNSFEHDPAKKWILEKFQEVCNKL